MHFVYLIEDPMTLRKYIGYTTDLRRRLSEHNRHHNASTRQGSDWKYIYIEGYLNKMDALGREKFLKSGSGWKYLRKQLRNYLAENFTT